MVLNARNDLTVFDGAIGTEVQKRAPGSEENLTDLLNLTRPEVIKDIHRDYVAAGARFLTTNTFSANEIRLARSNQEGKADEINERGADLARRAIEESSAREEISVAGSIGPTGETLVPLGDWTFDRFHEAFHAQAKSLKNGGADWIIIETMESLREATAALVATIEVGLPVISSLSYGNRKRTSYGVVPGSGAVTLDHLGADVLGINCGTGPAPYPDIINTYNEFTSKPLLAEANAGDPRLEDGEAVYDLTPEEYLEAIEPGLSLLSGVGSCCGSSPEFTKVLADVAPNYDGGTEPEKETKGEFISNNSTVIPVSDDPDFVEINISEGELTDLKEKVEKDRVNMLRLPESIRPTDELEKIIARQQLQLRSKKPLGIVTGDPELLKVFLTAQPGISPVRATGNEKSIRRVAEKYGGRLI
jgi:5-methyltetrahydrofolate--homocysteine methyltransferase